MRNITNEYKKHPLYHDFYPPYFIQYIIFFIILFLYKCSESGIEKQHITRFIYNSCFSLIGCLLAFYILYDLIHLLMKMPYASNANFMAGTENIYRRAGFKNYQNPMTAVDLSGVISRKISKVENEPLMVLPLKDEEWDPTAPLDLLGLVF